MIKELKKIESIFKDVFYQLSMEYTVTEVLKVEREQCLKILNKLLEEIIDY